jgi:3-dehydroquinate dehydratase/shikimate dehydrogenase
MIESPGDGRGRPPDGVDWIGLRADLLGDEAARDLAARLGRRAVYCLRSTAHGGRDESRPADRLGRLAAAAAWCDLVELEVGHDTEPEVLDAISPERRWVAWRGRAGSDALGKVVDEVSAIPAEVRSAEPWADAPGEGLDALEQLTRPSVRRAVGGWVIHARGPAAAWTRILAPWLGSAFAIGTEGPTSGGADDKAPPVAHLLRDYGLPRTARLERVFGIVGPGALGSSATALHNAGYRRAGIPALYLPFVSPAVDLSWVDQLAAGLEVRLGLSFGGVTVTAPHKEAAFRIACPVARSADARATRSANNLSGRAGRWRAETDGVGSVLSPLLRRGIRLPGLRAAVVGCGGAGRAAALALARGGASVTIVNRSTPRGEWASRLLGLPLRPLDGFRADGCDLLVHATPVGKHDRELLVDPSVMGRGAVVLDMVYRTDRPTELVDRARSFEQLVVDGHEVLAESVRRQYRLLTGAAIPAEVLGIGLCDPAPREGRS